MTALVARHIAQKYVKELGEVLPGFMYAVGKEEEFIGVFFFDFVMVTLNGQKPEKPPVVGGARGFTVNKNDGQVEVQTFGDYANLRIKENNLTEMHQLLSDFKNEKLRPIELKTKLNLNTRQLFELSKIIKHTELSRETSNTIISGRLDKVKNY